MMDPIGNEDQPLSGLQPSSQELIQKLDHGIPFFVSLDPLEFLLVIPDCANVRYLCT
jgi:hypothetical protein